MELKSYQSAALEAFARWRDALAAAQAKSDADIVALESLGVDVPPDVRNYPQTAWRQLAQNGEVAESAGAYVSRTDDADRPIPHVCFKVPTGGGKTLLAAAALGKLDRQRGLVLWITPTRAIYEQTKAALRNREHPYRAILEHASKHRVKLLEKDDPFTRGDVASYLCVMLLMLPAANRQKGKEFLRMFRDTGNYLSFFPASDSTQGERQLLNEFSDVERLCANPDCLAKQDPKNECGCGEEWKTGPVKRSLFNVLKMLRPVVVLDEAHKAYGKPDAAREFVRSVNRLDPSLVIELSATPYRGVSNLLVDITGVQLKQEQMIKLPVQVDSWPNAEWKTTLTEAYDKLEELAAEAESLHASEGRYIRPIAVVRVERTGKEQQGGGLIHAEDVRDYLTTNLGVPPEAVRVKSAENDELRNEDLLSEGSQVRWVITKAALMEGWDCPFAYLLVMLDNTQAARALTQLVGRVMRQPYARRTGRAPLDQCYVYCWNTDVSTAVLHVKNGLEQEGMSGLDGEVMGAAADLFTVSVQRRQQFRGQNIFLPMVLHKSGDGWRELDYQRHILPGVDWNAIAAPDPQSSMAERAARQSATVDVGSEPPVFRDDQVLEMDKTPSVLWFTRRLADVVPNLWHGARIVQDLLQRLRDNGQSDDDIYDRRSYLAYALREHVTDAVEKQAEQVFARKLQAGEIRFDLDASRPNFQMGDEFKITVAENAGAMLGNKGQPLQISLFEPVYSHHFNGLEAKFARYLDERKALQWWHRVAVRQKGDYYLRGWKQDRIWPDFIAMGSMKDGSPHFLVFETKGEHMAGSADTDYKRRVLEALENALRDGSTADYGTMTVQDGPAKGTFQLVFNEAEFPTTMRNLEA